MLLPASGASGEAPPMLFMSLIASAARDFAPAEQGRCNSVERRCHTFCHRTASHTTTAFLLLVYASHDPAVGRPPYSKIGAQDKELTNQTQEASPPSNLRRYGHKSGGKNHQMRPSGTKNKFDLAADNRSN